MTKKQERLNADYRLQTEHWVDSHGIWHVMWDGIDEEVRLVPMQETLMMLSKEELVEIILAYRQEETM